MVTEIPDGWAVLRHLGDAGADVSLDAAERCVRRTVALARSHTRGRGFSSQGDEVAGDLAQVIIRSAARALTNPAYPLRMNEETFTAHPGSFADWSESETEVLRRLRG